MITETEKEAFNMCHWAWRRKVKVFRKNVQFYTRLKYRVEFVEQRLHKMEIQMAQLKVESTDKKINKERQKLQPQLVCELFVFHIFLNKF